MINLFSFFSVSLFCYSYMFPSFLIMNFSLKNELTVISYNIRYDNPNDGENQWEYRKERVANYIKEIRPDIIGMQEVLDPQLVFLERENTLYKNKNALLKHSLN